MRQLFNLLLIAGFYTSLAWLSHPAHAAVAPPADTAQVRPLLLQARTLGHAGLLDSALQTAKNARQLSQRLGFAAGQARALYTLGKLEMQPGNLPAATSMRLWCRPAGCPPRRRCWRPRC